MMIKLRTATPDDISAIIALQTQIWEPTYRTILSSEQIQYMFDQIYSTESLTRQMTTQGHVFIVAETSPDETTELVGFASFSLTKRKTGPLDGYTSVGHVYKLHKIYVSLPTQGTGAGRQLLSEVELRCWQHGGSELVLNVNRFNKARDFYERLGFRVVREEDIAIGPYWMNDFVMAKELAAGSGSELPE